MSAGSSSSTLSSSRSRWLIAFLWVSAIAWGLGLGAKLFELLVVISAWAANPPASLSLLPYGPRYPFNPGDFFQPLSGLLVIGTIGSLVAGWRTPPSYKVWLWLPLLALLVIWVATPTLFWPMIRDLYGASTGTRPLGEGPAQALVNKWLLYDWVRTAFIAAGYACALHALATNHRAMSGRGDR
jgi:hypothetical protein